MALTLRQRFLGGVAWVTLSRIGVAVINLGVTAIVARLLTPSDFGIVAMALVFVGLAQQVRDFGVGQALIQLEEVTADKQKLAFTYALSAACVIYAILFATAGPIAAFYGNPQVVWVVRLLSLSFPLAAFAVVPNAMLRRNITLRGEAIATTLSMLLDAVVTVVMAVAGYGFWSLVVGKLAGVGGMSLFLAIASPWRPGVVFRHPERGRILRFGGGVTLSSVLWYAYTNADFLIVGRLLGSGPLGVYTMAFNLAKMPWDRMWASLSPLVLPLFSRARTNSVEIGRVLKTVSHHLSILLFPAVAGLGAVAPEAVSVILGGQWGDAVKPVIWLSVLGIVRGIAVLWGPVLIASGKVGQFVRFNTVCVLVLPLGFYVGTTWGITGVAIAWAVLYPVLAGVWLLPKALATAGVSAIDYLTSMREPALATGAMVAAVVVAGRFVTIEGPLRLAVLVTVGVAVYALAIRLLMGSIVQMIRSIVRDTREGIAA